MFTTARITLTVWYLLIIMLISIMFSFSIYNILTKELDREFHHITDRYSQQYGPLPPSVNPQLLEPSYLQASEDRVKWILIYVNMIIFGVSGVGGYILAGLTLRPIKKMVDEQNRFVTDASHELRTPLTSLKSEIEVYLRGKNHTTEEANAILNSNLEEVNSLQTLSDNLIELAQYKKSHQQQMRTSIFMQDAIAGAVKKVQKIAKQKNIILNIHTQGEKVYADEASLVQLFGIFLDNAIKYSPKNTTVSIQTHQTDGNIRITITDQGRGIAEKDIPHIFDRFYRADTSRTKQDTPGYGLGLSIAKKIVADHHGSISVTSAVGKGTTFTITLPVGK